MLKDIVIAFQAYGQAHRFIRRHNLWKWIIIPGIIYMLLFVVSMYFFGKSATSVIDFLLIKTHLNEWVTSMKSRLLGFFFSLSIINWQVTNKLKLLAIHSAGH